MLFLDRCIYNDVSVAATHNISLLAFQLNLIQVAYKKRERAQKRKEMEVLMKDNLLNILTVPGTPIRCESQDELEQLNKSSSQNSFERNNLYP